MRKSQYFSKADLILWFGSVLLVLLSFVLFDRENYLSLAASLIGVTSLIFNAKGNPFGQLLMILFSILYGIISYSYAYYGEMITYLGMTGPMALFAFLSWLANPFGGNQAEVTVNRLRQVEIVLMFVFTGAVTFFFSFILAYFNTENLFLSTLSVATSFIAVYLTFRRSPFFALAYAANDMVLIVLWGFASLENSSYLSVVICFILFFINDLYGFFHWKRMERRQRKILSAKKGKNL